MMMMMMMMVVVVMMIVQFVQACRTTRILSVLLRRMQFSFGTSSADLRYLMTC